MPDLDIVGDSGQFIGRLQSRAILAEGTARKEAVRFFLFIICHSFTGTLVSGERWIENRATDIFFF
jgi:hypothetical protein